MAKSDKRKPAQKAPRNSSRRSEIAAAQLKTCHCASQVADIYFEPSIHFYFTPLRRSMECFMAAIRFAPTEWLAIDA